MSSNFGPKTEDEPYKYLSLAFEYAVVAHVVISLSFLEDSLTGTFKAAGIEDVQHYRYWDAESNDVCVENMVHDLENAPEWCVVVLFASGHHPTGAELSQEDWKRVAEVMMVWSQNETRN